ncbi:g3625 [Coccomyxa elongata]
MEAEDPLQQRIRSLEQENEQLEAKKDTLAYRLIESEDALSRSNEQHNVLKAERDEARSCADAWWEEAKQQEARANAVQNENSWLAYYLGQERNMTAHLQAVLYKRDQLITFGQGTVQGMLQSQHGLQCEVQALHQECTTLTDENTLLRFIAGLPPRRSRSSAVIPASAVHCPAGAWPQPKEIASSGRERRLRHVKAPAAASGRCAAASRVLLIADCTASRTPSPGEAQERLSSTEGNTAERVLREWVEQPQHLMARPLQLEFALGAEHKMAQPDAAAKKSGIGGVIGRALGALFGLGQRKAPAVI